MRLTAPLTIGIEEEYQIIDPDTRELSAYVAKIMEKGRIVLGDQIKNEFMQSQVEVGSKICKDIHEAREQVIHLRKSVNDLASEHGRAILAASTHPFSRWQDQQFTEGQRYDDLLTTMQDAARRLLIFGLHIHIGIGSDRRAQDLTIDILNQLRYFLPHILALSTSSPFWHGRLTGMKSYRSLIFENMPRSGIPPIFTSYTEYDEYVELMSNIGALGKPDTQKKSGEPSPKDPTKIWWDARPHPNWGTLEIRAADMCTTVDETIAVVALVQALVAKLLKLRNQNRSWRIYPSHLISENKWLAVRYGVEGELIDFGLQEKASVKKLTEEILDVVDDVLDPLELRKDAERILEICDIGTSADRQIRTFTRQIEETQNRETALKAVVDQLIRETKLGWG